MQCLDFERFWNEQLDAGDAASPDREHKLEAHATVCPACRQIASRYQTLRQLLRATASPAPSADLLPRVLRAWEVDQKSVRRNLRIRAMIGPLALAASLLLILFVGRHSPRDARRGVPVVQTKTLPPAAGDPTLLTDALATARTATWDLARETSAPAARIGREFFDAATFREPSPESAPVPGLASTLLEPQTEVLEAVGEGVNAGVLPFSGTARQAFGFLLGSPEDQEIAAPNPATGS